MKRSRVTGGNTQFAVILVGMIAMLVIVSVSGMLLFSIVEKLNADAEHQVKVITQQAAEAISDRIILLESGIQSFSVQTADQEAIRPALESLKNSFELTQVAICDNEGNGIYSDGTPFKEEQLSSYGIVFEQRGILFSPTCTLADGSLGRIGRKPLYVNNEKIGMLYIAISSLTIVRPNKTALPEGDAYFILFDSSTKTIVVPPSESDNIPQWGDVSIYDFLHMIQQQGAYDPMIFNLNESIQEKSDVYMLQQAVSRNECALFKGSINGVNNYVCVAAIGRDVWYLCSIVPEEGIRAEASAVTTSFVLVFIIIVASLVAVSIMALFFYKKRMQEKEVEKKTHLYGALSDSLDMSVNLYSPSDGSLTPIVEKSLEVVGYTIAELIGSSTVATRAQLSEAGQAILRQIREGEIDVLERGEFSLLDKESSQQRWISYSINPFEYEGKRQYLVVFRNITIEKNLQISMNDAMVSAESANMAKSEFLSRMSHEIRTPMNIIIGMITIAIKDLDNKEKVKECLHKIKIASDHLLGLINEVLDISKIESGKVVILNKEFDLVELIHDVSSVTAAQCDQKNQTFTLDVDPNMEHWFVGDKLRIQQLLINLLNNSVKYTPEKGHIKLEAKLSPSSVFKYRTITFKISDDGIGMSDEFQEKLFDPFTMEERAESEGTGLGMPIVKNIITMLNGSIKMKSVLDEGTTFTVSLNLERVLEEGSEEELGLSETSIAGDNLASNNKSSSETEGIEPESLASQATQVFNTLRDDGEKLRILIAEDNELNAEIAEVLLQDAGFLVEHAFDGQKAVEMFRDSETGYYDAILMDIQMPTLDGYGATSEIRKLDREDASTVAIIAMSANAFAEDIQESLNHGMDDHLCKPIDVGLVANTINKHLKKRNESDSI